MQIKRFKSSCTLNSHETAPAIKSMHIRKSHKVSEGCPFKEAACHSIIITVMELVGVHKSKRGVRFRVGGPERVLSFSRTHSKPQGVTLSLRGSMQTLVTEHIWVNKPPGLTEFMVGSSHARVLPAILT